jgi:Domain of unknown function (DUF5666)
MKTLLRFLTLAAALLGASAGATAGATFAAAGRPAALAAAGQEAIIEGMVSARTDETLVVDDQAINTPASTPCEKDGRPVMLSDIQVGDWLKVTAFHDAAHDQYQAMAIEVLPKQD